MKKFNTSPISGMQELTPKTQAIFDKLKNEIAGVYHAHGFLSIETPIIERTDILLAKAGGDTEKQIYKVVKTAETADSADQALRFDHTVPLARYVVEHENDLTFPFKVTQIGRNFRGERAQKGRFREFYQLDADVIGREDLSVNYESEVIRTAYDALKTFIKPRLVIRVSNRKLLSGLIRYMGVQEKSEDIFSIIDHAEKVPKEKTLASFEEIGLSNSEIETISKFMSINGEREKIIGELESIEFNGKNILSSEAGDLFQEGIDELNEILTPFDAQNASSEDKIIADMLIVRGLDYYTGSVFETILPEYKEIGSICSGGRYDNLAGNYTDKKFPGVGISIGLTRLFYVLNENNLLDNPDEKPLDLVILPIEPLQTGALDLAQELAEKLRGCGKSVDINYEYSKKLGKRFEYASHIANYATVIGEDEAKTGNIEIKNLETGEKLKLEDYIR